MFGLSTSPEATTIILAAVLLLLFVVLFFLWVRLRGKSKPRTRYAEALNALLEGDDETALRELRQTVQAEPANRDAYFRLGNLLRKRGAVERALRIHRDLDVGTFLRHKLTREEKFRVREAIADDLLAARRPEEALRVLAELLDQQKENVKIRAKMLGLYERRSEWDEAYRLFREGLKVRKELDPVRLARYRAFCGTALLEGGDRERAKIVYLEALKLHAECPEALYRLGTLCYEDEELTQAISYWESFHKVAPEQAHLTFERLERALFEMGNLNRVEEMYRAILDKEPGETRTLLALSAFYSRRGEEEEAIGLVRRAVEKKPASAAARTRLALLLCETGAPDRVVEDLAGFLKENPAPDSPHTCSNCGHEARDPFWRCPQCLKWNTAFSRSGPSSRSS